MLPLCDFSVAFTPVNFANFAPQLLTFSAKSIIFDKNSDIMAIFKVEGGRRLSGEIKPQGAKNEALQILCATLLTEEKVVVDNIPQILDIIQLIDLLQAMGVKVERLSEDCYSFCAKDINLDYLASDDYRNRCAR